MLNRHPVGKTKRENIQKVDRPQKIVGIRGRTLPLIRHCCMDVKRINLIFQQLYEAGSIIPILQMGKQRQRGMEHSYAANLACRTHALWLQSLSFELSCYAVTSKVTF